MSLTKSEFVLLNYFRETRNITQRDMADKFSMSLGKVNKLVTDLKSKELINNTDKWIGTATPTGGFVQHIDSKSAAYWLKANEEAAKLKDAMTDEQKALIAAFEQHFPKSRLIEESMHKS